MFKRTSLLVSSALLFLGLAQNLYAFELGNTLITSVPKNSLNAKLARSAGNKSVALMNVKLTAKEKARVLSGLIDSTEPNLQFSSHKLPAEVDIGMNEVPVLDQGMHGTCVTFAVAAALDAALGQGDYISELCNLELGKYLENEGYAMSGWNGTDGGIVLDQILLFGIVSKDTQSTKSCANVTEYPVDDADNTASQMTLEEFKSKSENINSKIQTVEHLNFIKRFFSEFNDKKLAADTLDIVKKSLINKHRLVFATFLLLPQVGDCKVGACATYHANHDTWAITKELKQDILLAAHEMVIIGYDDNAEAIDQAGKKHRGLLILRNSWGKEVGDNGNYYMSYDFFKRFAFEVHEIVDIQETE